jgi:hypothetical protein
MPHLPEDRLALVRKLYESSELTIAEIAILAEVSESAIYQRARREQWATTRRPGVTPRRHKLRPPLPPTPALLALEGDGEPAKTQGEPPQAEPPRADPLQAEPAQPVAPAPSGVEDIDRAATAGRLWRAIDRHLEGLHEDGAPSGTIRAAQDLSALARTLQTLVGLEQGLGNQGHGARQAPADDEGPEDIDEFRNEIARRLECLLGARPV